jgi:hypothetical protein
MCCLIGIKKVLIKKYLKIVANHIEKMLNLQQAIVNCNTKVGDKF